ncbi:hypothetical protein EON83_25140 [bacterium]|nr:MAG: hypothetical protein EON83_25140 [bacterium]
MSGTPSLSPAPSYARYGKENWKYFTPALAGVLGAAQLSTACFIARPANSTDVMLSGAAGPDMLWAIPLGSLLGTALAWVILRLRDRPDVWLERRNSWFYALAGSIFVAPMAPGFLGLGPNTIAQQWKDFTTLYCIAWLLMIGIILLEKRRII